MIKFKVQPFIVILYISLQFSYAQSFVDDLYFSDSEVDYSFLHITESDEHNFPMDNDSIYYTNDNWDDDLTYENRIRKFHNNYNFNYYWDYGWHSPSWYNWHSPSYWNWSLNYHHYGWGTGFTYGLGWDYGWHNPYAYNYGWHNPYTYGYGMNYHYYWPGHYYPGAYGLWGNDYFIISNENFNFSYGHRDSNNTNIREHNSLNQERQINNTSQRPQNNNINQRPQNNNINQRPQNNNINQRPQNNNINQRPQNSNINQVSKSQRNKKRGSNLMGQIINSIMHDSGTTKSKHNQSKNQNNRSSMNRGFRSSSSKSSSSRSSSSRSSSSRGRN